MSNDCERVHHGYIGIALDVVSLSSLIIAAITKNQQYKKLARDVAVISGVTGTILILDDWQDVKKCILRMTT